MKMIKAYLLSTALASSVFLNILFILVMLDDQEYISQQDFAIQHLGSEANINAIDKQQLDDYRKANEALIEASTTSQLNEAVKNSPLPKLVMKG